jgi:hypothetical protein
MWGFILSNVDSRHVNLLFDTAQSRTCSVSKLYKERINFIFVELWRQDVLWTWQASPHRGGSRRWTRPFGWKMRALAPHTNGYGFICLSPKTSSEGETAKQSHTPIEKTFLRVFNGHRIAQHCRISYCYLISSFFLSFKGVPTVQFKLPKWQVAALVIFIQHQA